MKILLAGDDFVRNTQLRAAITEAGVSAEFAELSLPWPQVPFGAVAEVDEASGDEEAVASALADCDVVVTQMAPVTAAVLDRAPRLRLVVCTRGGPVNVNLAAAAEHGVAVSATPGRNAVAAAEYALLMMLAAMRNLPAVHDSVVAGEWRSDLYAYAACGSEMAGSTVGLIGLGEIGRRVAALVRAMGATVLAHDPFVAPDHVSGVELTTLEDLLGRSDVVSLHARLTPQTAGMIAAAQFAMMRPGTVLVNTARGGLLDYPAAAAALADGTLRSLALDVYEQEPVDPGLPLLSAPNVVLSPHLAGATRQTAERAARMAGAEVGRFANGEPLAYLKNGVTAAVPS
ncbi:MAG TPA: 2-hydroxyacid dehydrogenase [Nakamurella sp.]|nr:2-hydroxyacid dehydrogenase [Nakamurella sp.]